MRKLLFTGFIMLSLAACKKKDSIPNGILSQEKMTSVMADMMRAEQFLNNYMINKDTTLKREPESTKMYGQVLEFYHLTKSDFQKSFTYYQDHPALLKRVMDSLSLAVDAAPTEVYKPMSPLDSARRADVKKHLDSGRNKKVLRVDE